MKTSKKSTLVLGIVLYVVGLILGLLIASRSVMADYEAEFYGFAELSQGRFTTLRCPPVLKRNETGTIRVTLSNPLDRIVQPIIRVDLSSPTLEQSNRTQITLNPGQSQTLEWQVDQSNIDLRSFIFAKVFLYPVYPLPLREATCGIIVIDLPFLSGIQWLILFLVVSLTCLGVGLILLRRVQDQVIHRPRERYNALVAMAILLAAAIACGLLGWWVPGGILLVICVLLMAVMLLT